MLEFAGERQRHSKGKDGPSSGHHEMETMVKKPAQSNRSHRVDWRRREARWHTGTLAQEQTTRAILDLALVQTQNHLGVCASDRAPASMAGSQFHETHVQFTSNTCAPTLNSQVGRGLREEYTVQSRSDSTPQPTTQIEILHDEAIIQGKHLVHSTMCKSHHFSLPRFHTFSSAWQCSMRSDTTHGTRVDGLTILFIAAQRVPAYLSSLSPVCRTFRLQLRLTHNVEPLLLVGVLLAKTRLDLTISRDYGQHCKSRCDDFTPEGTQVTTSTTIQDHDIN